MHEISILVVSDDLQIRDMIVEGLQSFGHTCKVAVDGTEARKLIQGGKFDIVICDIQMSGLDGMELMTEVRKKWSNIPFIFITDYKNEHLLEGIIETGAHDFIKKPFTIEGLKARLSRTLKERHMEEENRRLYEEQAALNEKLRALLAVAHDLTAERDFQRLFHLIIGKVTEVMDAERTSLYIIDWEREEIWSLVAEHIGQIRLPIGKGISGRVAETGEMINVPDAWQLPYFNREFDVKNNFHTRSVLCMAVNNRDGERIGVLQVINKKTTESFDKNDVFILESLASQVAITLENSSLMKKLQMSFEGFIRTVSATVDAKDPLTAGHSKRVTDYSLMIAREIGLNEEEIEAIKYAALLHDVGKIGIRDSILLKKGRFTGEERAEMNSHPLKTRSILENFCFPDSLHEVPVIASQHHEKVNGKGYPYGLESDEISLGARILAVADVFDALTSARHYPKYTGNKILGYEAMLTSDAVRIIENETGAHFDAEVVAAFLKCLPGISSFSEEQSFGQMSLREQVAV
jgi:response regulator RpfG family c-di-GMP phosphodiesterase